MQQRHQQLPLQQMHRLICRMSCLSCRSNHNCCLCRGCAFYGAFMQNNLISRPDPFATMQRVKYALAGSGSGRSQQQHGQQNERLRQRTRTNVSSICLYVSSCYRKLSETDLIYIQIGAVRHMLLLLHATFAVFVARSSNSSNCTELLEELQTTTDWQPVSTGRCYLYEMLWITSLAVNVQFVF